MKGDFAYGVDLGWVTQLEAQGFVWLDENEKEIDPIKAAMDMGSDSIRLRIFVDPPKDAYWVKHKEDGVVENVMLGYCDSDSVLKMSKRATDMGMRLMLDFHYSDHFADPHFQDIPEAWISDDADGLAERVYEHTREVLEKFKAAGVEPEWVQVGNEINPGILLPMGSVDEHPKDLVRFLNRGYDGVKEVFPECLVITHLAEFTDIETCEKFFGNFFENEGRTDIIGFSNYPYWYADYLGKDSYDHPLPYYFELYSKYGKPIMITEIGGFDNEEEKTHDIIKETIDTLKAMPEGRGLGVFYWEPEIARDALPDGYFLGAARLLGEKKLQYTKALCAYNDSIQEEK